MEATVKPKILIVDDTPANLTLLRRLLAKLDAEVIETETGKNALELITMHDFALFILDVQMPVMNGYELADLLQHHKKTKDVPIIFVTAAYRDELHQLDGYQFGAIDYLEKPISNRILLAKVAVLLKLWHKNQMLLKVLEDIAENNFKLQTEIAERKKLETKLDRIAMYDSLTNLPNRTFLKKQASKQMAAAERYKYSVVFMFVDLDGFKAVNDNNGHETGDDVLVEMSYRMVNTVRECDIVTRYGGDEFVIMLPNCNLRQDAELIAKRVLDEVKLPISSVDINEKLSASMGISVYPQDAKTIGELISLADQAMYTAKQVGKNQFIFSKSNLN